MTRGGQAWGYAHGQWFEAVKLLLNRPREQAEELAIKQKAQDVVDFLNLKHLSNELAGNLSGGQKKLLELGRTMMVDAKLVVLDEVGAGVNRTLLKDLGTAILKLNTLSALISTGLKPNSPANSGPKSYV